MREMISTGNGPLKSATASKDSASSKGPRKDTMTSRTIGSRAPTARGVKTRETKARSRSCSGGSIMMMEAYIRMTSGSVCKVERSTPCAEENVCQSLCAAQTSS